MKARQSNLTTIGFDADDTLWQNEHFYRLTEARFAELLGEHRRCAGRVGAAARGRQAQSEALRLRHQELHAVDDRDGGRGDGRRPCRASVIGEILSIGREMLSHPIETLPHARETLEALAGSYRLVLITKGDLFDQERKLAQSGLGELFDAVEIVSDKDVDDLPPHLLAPRRRAGAEHDGRQFAEVGRRSGDRGRKLGRLCSARTHLGGRACRRAGRSSALPAGSSISGKLAAVIAEIEGR